MIHFLQLWGGIFFLFNKIFLSFAERAENKEGKQRSILPRWRMWAWVGFLVGAPAWIIIFIKAHNWIAVALEVGAIPSVVIGLIIAIRGKGKEPRWLHYLAIVCIVVGLSYSLYDFHGFNTYSQFAELMMTTGLLIGTYQIANKKVGGYLWFIPMHIACIWLMYTQNHPWLVAQQVISIFFVLDAYSVRKKRMNEK